MKKFIDFIIGLFRDKKSFKCGSESCIEFKGSSGELSHIFYRQPTGDEILNFAHEALANDESELRVLSGKELDTAKLHEIARRKKFVPYAKKVITRWDGYLDKDGKGVKDLSFLIEYFPHHLETVAYWAFDVRDTHKKKD